ncbi:MAG: hypothetical protein ACFB2Y_23600 [Fulvivirga sp.]
MRYILFFLVASFFLSGCENPSYEIVIEFKEDVEFKERIPIYYNHSFVRWESKALSDGDKTYLKLLIPDSVKIPMGSQFISGHVDFLSSIGLNINPSNSIQSINDSDTIQGVYKEEIIVNIKKTDPKMVEEALDIMKNFIEMKKDSI